MSLIIENGSNIPGANSYVDAAYVRATLLARGIAVSDDDVQIEQIIYRGMDEIESRSYAGTRTYTDQSRSFPRSGITIDGVELPDNEIPARLKQALALYYDYTANRGADTAAVAGPFVTHQKVDVIERRFSDKHISASKGGNGDGLSQTGLMDLPLIEALLKPLIFTGNDNGDMTQGGLVYVV